MDTTAQCCSPHSNLSFPPFVFLRRSCFRQCVNVFRFRAVHFKYLFFPFIFIFFFFFRSVVVVVDVPLLLYLVLFLLLLLYILVDVQS